MNDAQIKLFIELIAAHMGLETRPQDRSALCRKLLNRMKAVKIISPEKYYQMYGFEHGTNERVRIHAGSDEEIPATDFNN